MRVLVIEDDEEMAQAIAFGLRQTGIAVDVALDGPAGLARSLVNEYDVIVLDRDLPLDRGPSVRGAPYRGSAAMRGQLIYRPFNGRHARPSRASNSAAAAGPSPPAA